MERQLFTVWLVLSSQILFAHAAVPQNAIEIYSLHVDCKVTSRFAHTVITSRVTNRANESKEALFEVELPKTAFITQFLMNIDGVTYPGIIKEKEAAQDQYDAAVSRGQSAGLVKSAGRKLEQFQVSVNVAAAGKVTFELTYEELLKRKLGKYEVLIKVKPKQLVNDFQIVAHIFEPQGISLLETDSTFMTNDLNNALIKEQDETKAHISFKPTISQQRKDPELEETLLDGDFLIRYDVKRSASAGDIQIVNGYFVHYFAPSEMAVLPKNIIFVIDKSGSMSGKKIDQTREALQKILEDLNPEDHFNLVVFSADVAAWKPSLLQATEENVEMAKQYVRTIRAQGGTDINGALLRAIGTLDEATAAELLPEESISMIILLTDGQPTVGVTEVGTIQSNIKGANQGKYFLYCLGFGFDVSYKFLEKMALDNGGVARRIYEDSDAALQLQDFYQEVATPILKEIEMKYPDSAALEITQNTFKLLFDGSEIVVAGKIGNEIDVFPVEISAQTHSKALVLKEYANVTEKEQIFQNQQYIFGNFTERLWAYLTIQQLLEKDVLAKGEQKKNLEAEALALSLKFNFVTPLTSMVVTKPDAQDVANKPTEADNENVRRRAYLLMHSRTSAYLPVGTGFVVQPGPPGPPGQPGLPGHAYTPQSSHPDMMFLRKTDTSLSDITLTPSGRRSTITREYMVVQRALNYPHFIITLPGENDLICLHVSGQSQTPINLLSDPAKGIQITGKRGENGQFVHFEIAYQQPDVKITIAREGIVLNHTGNATMFPWTTTTAVTIQGLEIKIEEDKSLLLSGASNTLKISYDKLHEHFLGLYFIGGEHFSDQVTGLLGKFFFNTHFGRKSGGKKLINVQGQTYVAIRDRKRDYRVESPGNISCWSVAITP